MHNQRLPLTGLPGVHNEGNNLLFSKKQKLQNVLYSRGAVCVCVCVCGGGGGGATSCATVEMTRDCCEKGPFKLVIGLLFSITHGKKQGVYVGKLDA